MIFRDRTNAVLKGGALDNSTRRMAAPPYEKAAQRQLASQVDASLPQKRVWRDAQLANTTVAAVGHGSSSSNKMVPKMMPERNNPPTLAGRGETIVRWFTYLKKNRSHHAWIGIWEGHFRVR